MTSRSKTPLSTSSPMTIKSTGNFRDYKNEESKTTSYIEKQNQLSDWYYIKTKTKVKITEKSDDVLQSARKKSSHSTNHECCDPIVATDGDKNLDSHKERSDDFLHSGRNDLNYTMQLQANPIGKSSKSASFSLNRKTDVSSRRYTDTIPLTIHKSIKEQEIRLSVKRNYFKDINQFIQYDVPGKIQDINNQGEDFSKYQKGKTALHDEDINKLKSNDVIPLTLVAVPVYKKDISPPICADQKKLSNEKSSCFPTDNAVFSKVNVRLLMQQYQQNQQQHNVHSAKVTTDSENMSFQGCVEFDITESSDLTDVVTSKDFKQQNIRSDTKDAPNESGSIIVHLYQQHQHECKCGNCINIKETKMVESINLSNKQNESCSYISHVLFKQKQEYPFYENTPINTTIAQRCSVSKNRESALRCLSRRQRQQQLPSQLGTEQEKDTHLYSVIHPFTSDSRTQNHSDETRCSSIEHLNMIETTHKESSRTQQNVFDVSNKATENHALSIQSTIVKPPTSIELLKINEEHDNLTFFETKKCLERAHQLESQGSRKEEYKRVSMNSQSKNHIKMHHNSQRTKLLDVLEPEMFPPKTSISCRSECELSGSYASLDCPSPPGPPVSIPESQRDPQARLCSYMRSFYIDLALKEPIIPQWAIPVAPGALCAARLEPDLRFNSNSHGISDSLTIDQILVTMQSNDGNFFDAPKRCLIECPAWVPRSNLCLRIVQAWAKEPPWPTKGTPVALVLFIPLAEVKRSFSNYVEKELIAKGSSNPFISCNGGFSAAWSSLAALGPKLLFILDGYDNQKFGYSAYGVGSPKKSKSYANIMSGASKHLYPTDVHELLDGKLFPESRVIITTSTANFPELLPIIQRHLIYEGLTWGRSATLLSGGQWSCSSLLLDAVQENIHLRKVVRTSIGCLAITALNETMGGNLPTDEMDIVESILNCVAPETTITNVSELGRLALFCLKTKRHYFTINELRMYCSTSECSLLGCFDKNLLLGRSAKKKGEYIFYPICAGMMELLAANYISSLASRPGILAAEITGMAVGDELVPDLFKVLKFAMTILGDRAHILLSKLTPLWLTPQTIFSLALASGHAEENMAALCDILGITKHPPISPLETKPLWVQVRSLPTDLMGWGMALKSPSCTLKNLEVIYQLEKHNLLESRKAIEIFLDAIINNESVSTLKISSLIEMDVKDSEINYLANFVSNILLKPRLENFELVLTLLEEDPPTLKLQSVVTALCRTISRQPKLSFLLLDVTLNTSQIVQLCSTLEKCTNVTRLSLPHLRCERGAIAALASLLNSRPISFLSLPSCWGARDDPPSSSGVSMGSGSGSSTGTSGLIKQGSLPGVPSPRSYAPGIFSSLPRGVFLPQSSLSRSATLPRQPLEQTLDKRSCDSVVSKNWYPTPACDGGPHNSGTLHDLFSAARDSFSKLHGLDLSKAQLSLEDSMCLGETVRLSKTLHTLKLEGSSRLSEILPSVLGASDSSCLQMLSIGSPRLNLEDSVIAMVARSLTNCSTLRLLSVDGWSFRIENSSTLSILGAFVSLTYIRELSLSNCRLQINLINNDTKIDYGFQSRSLVVLKLAGAQATLADSTTIGGPQLLQFIGCFSCLRELDLSAPARSGMSGTHTTPLIIDDKCVINFFQNLHSYFGLLNTLKICHWIIHFDDLSKTLKTISKCLRNSPISHLKMDGISVLDRPKKQRSEVNFMHCFISSLPLIRWMGISLAGKKEDQITAIGNAVLDLKGSEIDIKLSESTIEHAKLMAQAISLDGKFDIKVSTFGTSSGILVHAEKSGAKTLTRKIKE